MRLTTDNEADAFYARLQPEGVAIARTEEIEDGVLVDYDASNQIVGLEILNWSQWERQGEAALETALAAAEKRKFVPA